MSKDIESRIASLERQTWFLRSALVKVATLIARLYAVDDGPEFQAELQETLASLADQEPDDR